MNDGAFVDGFEPLAIAGVGALDDVAFVDVFEPIAIAGMGVALVILAFKLYRKNVLGLPPAVALGISGFLAWAWKYPDLVFTPDELRLPFEVAEVQFFVSLSICMTLFALDVFIGQARALAKAEEILALQRAELEKAAVMQQMAAIIESSEDAIIGATYDGAIATWNRAAETIFGERIKAKQGELLTSLVDLGVQEDVWRRIDDARRGQRVENFETVCERGNGNLFDAVWTLAPIRDASGDVTGVSVIGRDITEAKRAQELREMAHTDELTGLSNRRRFTLMAERQAVEARQTGKPFTVLFIDLNGLKNINDNLGHQEGDQAIKDAADIIRSTFRDSDVLARLGGDEFCVLLPEEEPEHAESPIARLQAMTDIHNMQSSRPYKVGMSVGIARFDPTEPISVEDLIERADAAMYDEKMSDRGHRRYRLMVCDDDPSVCSLVEVMFGDDYDVSKAYSGKQVVEMATRERPDLILLDLHLPDMMGTEVVKLLRNSGATKMTPIIMITGAGSSNAEIDSLKAGVDDYVQKPFEEDALRARMDLVLKRSLRR
ncbi:MAG TPA: diguanylate cyclase [Actinomycetota bacterium]|nr:diguanylate cyclase [Actinomycetota bacterium]